MSYFFPSLLIKYWTVTPLLFNLAPSCQHTPLCNKLPLSRKLYSRIDWSHYWIAWFAFPHLDVCYKTLILRGWWLAKLACLILLYVPLRFLLVYYSLMTKNRLCAHVHEHWLKWKYDGLHATPSDFWYLNWNLWGTLKCWSLYLSNPIHAIARPLITNEGPRGSIPRGSWMLGSEA